MRLRSRLFIVLLVLCGAAAPARAASVNGDGSEVAVGLAEAQRLYDRANEFVTNIPEGDYSYAYIQFFWKRAQSNIDRIIRVYPATPTARALRSGELKLGPYEVSYFKERVLPALEEKKLHAFDAVNCAIFLYNRDPQRQDDTRRAALQAILEVLSRQKRWGEALKFPVLDSDRFLRQSTVFRIAARFEQNDVVKDLLANAPKDDRIKMNTILGEALALRGLPRKDIAALLDKQPADEVKLGVLSGMIQREVKIQRAAALRVPTQNILLAGDVLKRPETRDDVNAVAAAFFPKGHPAASALLAEFRAALGERPAPRTETSAHLAYLEHLAAFEKFDELTAYLRQASLSREARVACELKAIEFLAEAGRAADAQPLLQRFAKADAALTEAAALAQFRGQMRSIEVPLVVREKTFVSLPMKDPCVLAQAIMEWSLTPNRSIRGAAPYDAVVQKFAPGFTQLAAPKSKAVGEASSVQKPY